MSAERIRFGTGNVEEGVYVCGWSREGGVWKVWVKSHPKVHAAHRNLDKSIELLCAAITDAGGAVRPLTEFDPPLREGTPDPLLRHGLVRIYGDGTADWERSETWGVLETKERIASCKDKYFTEPVCRSCHRTRGKRNNVPARIGGIESGYDGFHTTICSHWFLRCLLLSDRFIALLSRKERASLELQVVDRPGGRKPLYELVGPSGPPCVGVRGVKELAGWRCRECKLEWLYCPSWVIGFDAAIAESDLPDPIPDIFTIGRQPSQMLVATANRWSRMVGTSGTRGFVSSPVAVVPPDRVIRGEDMKLRSRF